MSQHNRNETPAFESLEQRRLLSATTYLSDMNWATASNGWGPVERDRSVNNAAAGDGQRLRIGSASYDKGLGVHANSDIRYSLNGQYDRFYSDFGIDEESGNDGSVNFQVLGDGRVLFNSGRITGAQGAGKIDVSVAGVKELRLVATDAGDGSSRDHADWGSARLVSNSAVQPAAQVGATAATSTPSSTTVATPTAGMIVVGPYEAIKSIGQAINMAQPGQTIFIRNGTYYESISFNKSGQSGKPITLQAQSVGGVTIDAGGRGVGLNGEYSSWWTVRGIKIVNVNNPVAMSYGALRVGSNWLVEDVVVQGAANTGITIRGNNSTFNRVSATRNGQLGWGGFGSYSTLNNCSSINNNYAGKHGSSYEAGGAKFYQTNGVTLNGGTWANNGGPAIWFDWQNRNFVVRNTQVYGNWGSGTNQGWAGVGLVSEISDGPGLFENNNIHDNTGAGVAIWEAFNVIVRNNRITNDTIDFRNNPGRGSYSVRNIRIEGNTVVNGALTSPLISRNLFASRNIVLVGNIGI